MGLIDGIKKLFNAKSESSEKKDSKRLDGGVITQKGREADWEKKPERKKTGESESSSSPVRFNREIDKNVLESERSSLLLREKDKQVEFEPETKNFIPLYEKLAKIEEILRVVDDRLVILDAKVATRDDTRELKGILLDSNNKSDSISQKIDNIQERLSFLLRKKDELDKLEQQGEKIMKIAEKRKKIVENEIKLIESHYNIIDKLKSGPKTTKELALLLNFTRQYIWERIKELEEIGLVKQKKKGRKTYYYVAEGPENDLSTDK